MQGFQGGVKQLNFCLLFFCIFLFPTRKLLPYPRGVHYWSWNRNRTICRFLAGPWNSVHRLTNFVGLFEAFLKKVKHVYRGPFWGHIFLIKTLWLFFFRRRSVCAFTYLPIFFFFACVFCNMHCRKKTWPNFALWKIAELWVLVSLKWDGIWKKKEVSAVPLSLL